MWSLLEAMRREERGFSYLMVMMAITVMGLALTVAARQWKTMVQRELESDLLAKGIEIQTALALYSASAKAGRVIPGEVYPQTLAELTRPPKPFLRKVYLDPLAHSDLELLRAPTGGIMGVRSKSKLKPIKQGNFPLAVRHFEGKPTHYDWVFQYPNPSMVGGPVTSPSPVLARPAIVGQPLVPVDPIIRDQSTAAEPIIPADDAMDSSDSPSSMPSESPTEPVVPSEAMQ